MENYQLAVIGSGSGGAEAALLAAKNGFRVALIEKERLGGTRLHRGCYAVRALHASGRMFRDFLGGGKFGIEADLLRNSLVDWMKSQRAASVRLADELKADLEKLSVKILSGTGSLVDQHVVRITGEWGDSTDIEAEHIFISTGSRPDYHSTPGSRIINSDDLIQRINPPAHLLVVGGGYVGCEFAAIYRQFGCQVTVAEQAERLLPSWDETVSKHVASQLTASGVELLLGAKIDVKDLPMEAGFPIVTRPDGSEMAPDLILVATGRSPNTESLGLEALGIGAKPFIEVDAQLRTAQRHIFAIGDVNGLNMLDSSATAQARVACEAITGGDSIFSSRWVPRYLDTDPPVAAVGWMEHEAEAADFNVEVRTESVKLVTSDDRTVVEPSLTQVKLIVEQQTKQLRGCVIIGQQASEVINLAALAIQSGLNTRDIGRLLLVHPSVSVAFQRCAAKFA